MAHFAKLDANNIVTDVIVVGDDDCLDDNNNESEAVGIAFCQSLFGSDTTWKQTSYNATIRKNFAAVGYEYDSAKDAFIAPQPYNSWTLNTTTCQWEAPTSHPTDGKSYYWDEPTTTWIEKT